MAEQQRRIVAWLLDFINLPASATSVYTSFWSGTGNLFYNGRNYIGTNGIVSVSQYSVELGEPATRFSASMQLGADVALQELLVDNGPYDITVDWIYSLDNGATWNRLERLITGKISRPLIKNQIYSVEIETIHGDVDRGEIKYWSDEDQKRLYPGDRGLEYMRKISEGIDIRWPP